MITLPPINMEPDVQGSSQKEMVFQAPPNVRFHVNWWQGNHPLLISMVLVGIQAIWSGIPRHVNKQGLMNMGSTLAARQKITEMLWMGESSFRASLF